MTDTPQYQTLTASQLANLEHRIRYLADASPHHWTEHAIRDAHILAARIYTAVIQSGISVDDWNAVAGTPDSALMAIRSRDIRLHHARALAERDDVV